MGRASGGLNTPHWIRNNIPDFLRAMSMKIVIENGKNCNKTTNVPPPISHQDLFSNLSKFDEKMFFSVGGAEREH